MANIANRSNGSNRNNGNAEGNRNDAVRKTVKFKTVKNLIGKVAKASVKASTKEIGTTGNNVQAIVTESTLNITPETTLNELISLARNNAVEKPKVKPKFITLHRNARCVASLKGGVFNLFVYDNGYAGYEAYGRTTVIDLDEIFTVTYPSNYYDATLDTSTIGNYPWGYTLVILGDEQIDFQWNKEKAHDFVSEDDNGSISADAYNCGCAYDCGGLSGSQKINQPALAAHIDDPETAYIKKETNREIRWALSKTRAEMTEKQAEAFRLYYDEDMTLEEIGIALGIEIQSVADRLEGVSKKLHKNMKQFL